MNKAKHFSMWTLNISAVLLIVFFQLYMIKNFPQLLPAILAVIASAICIGITKYVILKEESHNIHTHAARIALIVGIAGLMLSFFFLSIIIFSETSSPLLVILK